MVLLPRWRNGIRSGPKNLWEQSREGSIPSLGTKSEILPSGGFFRKKKPWSLGTRDGELLDPAELDEDGVENVTKEEPHKDNENNYSDDRENKRVGARHG